MAHNVPVELASALQSTSIKRHPDPRIDMNPSTAASKKTPVTISSSPANSDVAEDEIPVSLLDPIPRRKTMPPLPDLRYEQSYLKRIEKAESWQGVLWITFKDEVGVMWSSNQNGSLYAAIGDVGIPTRWRSGTSLVGLGTLEQISELQREDCRLEAEEMVVGCQQLGGTVRKEEE